MCAGATPRDVIFGFKKQTDFELNVFFLLSAHRRLNPQRVDNCGEICGFIAETGSQTDACAVAAPFVQVRANTRAFSYYFLFFNIIICQKLIFVVSDCCVVLCLSVGVCGIAG